MKKSVMIIIAIVLVVAVVGTLWYMGNEIKELKSENATLCSENYELNKLVDHHEDEITSLLLDMNRAMQEHADDSRFDNIPNCRHRDYGDDLMGKMWNVNYEIDTIEEYFNIVNDLIK